MQPNSRYGPKRKPKAAFMNADITNDFRNEKITKDAYGRDRKDPLNASGSVRSRLPRGIGPNSKLKIKPSAVGKQEEFSASANGSVYLMSGSVV